MRVAGFTESRRHAFPIGRIGLSRASSTRNKRARIGHAGTEVLVLIEPAIILLVEVVTISKAHTCPTRKEYAGAGDTVHRMVLECVRGAAANVARAAEFDDRLEPLVDREIHADTGLNFIGPIKKRVRAAREITLRR